MTSVSAEMISVWLMLRPRLFFSRQADFTTLLLQRILVPTASAVIAAVMGTVKPKAVKVAVLLKAINPDSKSSYINNNRIAINIGWLLRHIIEDIFPSSKLV